MIIDFLIWLDERKYIKDNNLPKDYFNLVHYTMNGKKYTITKKELLKKGFPNV